MLNPTRCFQCQKFGHGKTSCRNQLTCSKCAEKGHSGLECTKEPKCVNCEGAHESSSKECPVWIKEKNIQKIKVEENISYFDARRKVSSDSSIKSSSDPMSYAGKTKSNIVDRTFKDQGTQTVGTWPRTSDQMYYIPAYEPSNKDKIIIPTVQSISSQTSASSSEISKSSSSKSSDISKLSSSNEKSKSEIQKSSNISVKGKTQAKPVSHSDRLQKAEQNVLNQNRFEELASESVSMDYTVWGDAMDSLPPDKDSQRKRSPNKKGAKTRSPSRGRLIRLGPLSPLKTPIKK